MSIHPNIKKIRADFPILETSVRGKPLIYLDNAATTQKPRQVIERIQKYYQEENANIHRGVHYLSERATIAYENTRKKVQKFIGAESPKEIVFTRGTTEGINLVAQTFGRLRVKAGDQILISEMEHHSNIVPWQLLCEQVGATLNVIPFDFKGELMEAEFDRQIERYAENIKLIALTHVSNALGTINPVERLIQKAHAEEIPVLLDGAQAVPHLPVDVKKLDCDFYVFSAHKIYGPTGVGVLYAKKQWLEEMPPYQGGGDMISSVTFKKTTYNEVPYKFEAGTPNIEGVIALEAALDYVSSLGLEKIAAHEMALLKQLEQAVQADAKLKEFVRPVGTAKEKAAVYSFTLGDIHPHDAGTILDRMGIAVRGGHHCAQPVMDHFGIPGTLRASFAVYNTPEEVNALVTGLHQVLEVFK
ncbi:cysteine desulfurase [bacterium]|nr:cysteine desulfurase [bacterium]